MEPVLPTVSKQVSEPLDTGVAGNTFVVGISEFPPHNLRSQKNTTRLYSRKKTTEQDEKKGKKAKSTIGLLLNVI